MTEIWVPLIASAIGGILGIAASLTVYSLGKRRSEREARHEAKRVAVSRMLDVLDDAIKIQGFPPLIRHWRGADGAVMLALSRLLLDLPKDDLPVALWAGSQVQRMVFERAKKEYLFRATKLQSRLVSWYRGDVQVQWFSDALRDEPYMEDWRPSAAVRAKAELRDIAANLTYLAAAALTYALVRETLLPTASRIVRGDFGGPTE